MSVVAAPQNISAIATKLADIRSFREREAGLIGRRTEMLVTHVALAARLHIILHGKPGVAKSMTVDGLMRHMPDLRKFKTQAYKASPPEQFLGPISFKGMEQDKFVRIVARKVADCEVAIIDELPRAPRAVLPAFQGMMVEREFDAGDGVQPVPLQSLVGTSNHLPTDEELQAFLDRFALKLVVQSPQSQDQFKDILRGALRRHEQGEPVIPDELIVSGAEWEQFQTHVTRVHVPEEILDALGELWANLLGKGIEPSIRRYTDLLKAVRSCAALDGRDEAVLDDMQIAQYSLWTTEEEIPDVYAEVVNFASEWVKEKADLLNGFADTLDRLNEIQSLVAAGTDTSSQATVGDKSRSITDHGVKLVAEQRKVRELIEKHINAATGQDTADLEAALVQIDAAKAWVQDRLLGGLSL